MLAFVHPTDVAAVLEVAQRWEIESAVIGHVTEGGTLEVRQSGEVVSRVPASSLSEDAPLLDRPAARPEWLDALQAARFDPGPIDEAAVLLELLGDPAIGSTAWVHEQYDHMLFLNTVVGPGGDGALLRLKGTEKALALSTDGNGRLCHLDPRIGAARLVYESALNVAVCGARPIALVDNLNLGNPEKPEVMWQLIETIEGISQACEVLGIPVIGGNVSLYNETDGVDIHPTPVVGVLGLADPMPLPPPRLGNGREGMEIWEIGPEAGDNLAGSALQRIRGALGGRPTSPSPSAAIVSIRAATRLAYLAPVLHDISDGGAAVALTEICIASGVGAEASISNPFSEDPHRFLACFEPGSVDLDGVPARRIGLLGGEAVVINGRSVDIGVAEEAWRQAIPRALAG
jgi:phosphoribosylformylglycinamidine synthase